MTTGNLQDILNDELKQNNQRVLVNKVYNVDFSENKLYKRNLEDYSKSPSDAKDIYQFYDIVENAIDNFQTRLNTPEQDRVIFTEEEPDFAAIPEVITASLVERCPGAFQSGAPMEAKVRNRKELFRQEIQDPQNPGYLMQVAGTFYDSIVRFTCWAKTNKEANARVRWFMSMMNDYRWWFVLEGIQRVFFHKQGSDLVEEVNEQKWYGRPLDFFVRTEDISVYSEKTIEEIVINMALHTG